MRLLADTSAWVAYLRGDGSPANLAMATAFTNHQILLPDLVRYEVLRGMPDERSAVRLARDLDRFESVDVSGVELADTAAALYRKLRNVGVTLRGSIDLLLGTWCLMNDISIIHQDRDFTTMQTHLGLKIWQGN